MINPWLFLYLGNGNYAHAANLVAASINTGSNWGYYRLIMRVPGCQKCYMELAPGHYKCSHLHFHFL